MTLEERGARAEAAEAELELYKNMYMEAARGKCEADARVEALERALKSREANTSVLCFACYTCAHEQEDTIYCAEKCGRDRKNWQFDEARFTEGGERYA